MRILQIFTFLLLLACVAVAQQTPPPAATLPKHNFAVDVQHPQIRTWVQTSGVPQTFETLQQQDANTCYFIRSYIMKREGEAGATHLDHVTTCTPKSRIRMKTKVKFTPAVEQ